ncbi:class I SAM-dependent methyltransferase [Nocardioides sp.]|uniref:class I SAM-dependent methyltransferase n=1 Tax=Nocardioides sp. TaxID=35761 RepID=UPI001998F9C7|nr:class I SAM-dependent methyltransferase [Nocardioides sp.]MBC7276903.1 class I SAM-dependent methyltransferase [Nocardioides sp.]
MALRTWSEQFAGGIISDAVATLNARHPWSHNDHFHSWILANLPARRRTALDVGCGQGGLLAALSPRFTTVHGTDRDGAMRGQAATRCAGLSNVTIHDGTWIDGPVDLVTMVAVLHHLDVADALEQVRDILEPDGRFLSVGLAPPQDVTDHLWDLASMVTNPAIGYVKHPWPSDDGASQPVVPVKDPTMSFAELHGILADVMPGASIRHRLGFRHTIAWTKPA